MDSKFLGSAVEMLILEVAGQGQTYGYELAQTAGNSDTHQLGGRRGIQTPINLGGEFRNSDTHQLGGIQTPINLADGAIGQDIGS
jgi:hypothetical protein